MEKEAVEIFVKRLIHVIWENQELEKLDRFYTADVEGYYNQDKVTFDTLGAKVKSFRNHMKNLRIEILHLAVEKNKYALHANQIFQTDDGKEISIPSMMFVHLKDDKIHRYWLKTRTPLDFNEAHALEDTSH